MQRFAIHLGWEGVDDVEYPPIVFDHDVVYRKVIDRLHLG